MSLVGITFSHMNWSLDSNKNKSFRYVLNRNNHWEKLISKLSPVLNLKYRTCVMAKSLLKFIVKIVMTLLTHTVVKFLMDKNPHFILISAFYSHFSVLSPFQRFILISAFYPHFSVLSPFQFQFLPFSFSVLSRPVHDHRMFAILSRSCLYITYYQVIVWFPVKFGKDVHS